MGPGGTDEGEAEMGTRETGHPVPGLWVGGLGPRFLQLRVLPCLQAASMSL